MGSLHFELSVFLPHRAPYQEWRDTLQYFLTEHGASPSVQLLTKEMLREKGQTIKANLARGDSEWVRPTNSTARSPSRDVAGAPRIHFHYPQPPPLSPFLSPLRTPPADLRWTGTHHLQVNVREKATMDILRLYDKGGVAHCNLCFESHEALNSHKAACAFRPTPCNNVGCLEARRGLPPFFTPRRQRSAVVELHHPMRRPAGRQLRQSPAGGAGGGSARLL